MAIKNSSLPDADEVMNAMGSLFNDTAQNIFNADYIGFDSRLNNTGSPNYKNVIYNLIDEGVDTANSDLEVSPLISANSLDEFNDNSVDGNIWSTSISSSGSISESSDGLFMTNSNNSTTNTATANQASAINFNQDSTIFVKGSSTKFSGTGTPSALHHDIRLVDTSGNSVQLHTHDESVIGTKSYELRITIDPSSNEAIVYSTINGTNGGSTKDLTSLVDGDNWRIQFYLNSSAGTGNGVIEADIRSFRYLLNSGVTKTIEFDTETITSTDNLILIANDDTTSGSIVYSVSLDNGSTFQTTTPTEIERFSSSGTQFKLKAELTGTVDNVSLLNEHAVKYNLY